MGCDEAELSEEKRLCSESRQGIRWMKALVRNSTGKAIQWTAGPWKLKFSAVITFPNFSSYTLTTNGSCSKRGPKLLSAFRITHHSVKMSFPRRKIRFRIQEAATCALENAESNPRWRTSSQKNIRKPQPPLLATPACCIARHLQFALCPWAARKWKYCQYPSHSWKKGKRPPPPRFQPY